MTFVSYAQNFEDVLLWRALRHVGHGRYIDVGAAHPEVDSVTRAFYDRGWSGINVEPVEAYARRLEAARGRDLTLRVALGETAGERPFFTVPDTGLSTLEASVAQACRDQGFTVREGTVRVETLAAVCRRHAPPDIHFLKVDVEGAEHAVLAGADFTAFRPWIVLVEATRPMSTEEPHATWEPLLLDAGYRFAWFDGLNRFYLAAERHAELAPHFRTPPNVFDDFLRAADTEWARRIHAAEAAATELRDRTRVAEDWARLAEDRAEAVSRQLVGSAANESLVRSQARRLEEMRTAAAVLRAALANEQARAVQAETRLAVTLDSTSWRVTRPLRRLKQAASGDRLHEAPPLPMPSGPPSEPTPPNSVSPNSVPPAALPTPSVAAIAPPASPMPPVARATGPLRTIHQFHSGSAFGDAITNAMLLTRRLLRDLGYASEIFVEHRDPLLADQLRLLRELPRHADFVLIVRHSMGYDAFTEVAALPARKILLYHNITPPELLAGDSPMQAHARLGRRQLAVWRPHVAAALADSEYNAIELRALGFDAVRACTLLFDLDTLRADAPQRPAPAAPCFTILFVGRVTAAKAQHDLLAAYARFRERFASPSRLVIVGRLDDGTGYVERLHAQIQAAALGAHVVFTGLVSDAELRGWYAAADLYVSLSHHEGFGVPLVEAVSRGVPVLAWPSGAVPYTLGTADAGQGLLPDRHPDAVAARMAELARDPGARTLLRLRQRAAVDPFRLKHQVPALLHALVAAGAAPPADPATREALAANLRFTVTGHASGSYSIAATNRAFALALDAAAPGRVRLAPLELHQPAALTGLPAADVAAVTALAARPPFATGPEVVVSNHYPVHVPDAAGDLPLALFAWEESLVPAGTVARMNQGFRGVLATSRFVAKALLDSGLAIPVRALGQTLDLAPFQALARDRRAAPRTAGPVSFLHVSSCFPRKGVDLLLAAYAAAFRAADPVRLVIKGFPNPHNDAAAQVAALRARDPDAPAVELVDHDLDTPALLELYRDADAMVLPTRGEGFNMTAAEAMAAGLPLIVTGAGGHMDFCSPETARLLAWRHAPSRTHLAVPHSLWVEPDHADLVAALREMAAACRDGAEAGRALAERSRRAEAAVAVAADGAALAARMAGTALDLLLAPPPPPLRLAWISSWDVRCGIAEYSRHLLEGFPETGDLAAVTVLADDRTAVSDHAGGPRIRRAWRQGDPASLAGLLDAVAQEDPHILVVQHQPGLLGFAELTRLLRAPPLAGRVVAVTLHTVQHLVEAAPPTRDATVAALATAARVIVHTLADLERLRLLGLGGNVTLIPQGARPARPARPVRVLAEGAAPLIGCYGFFLPGKGIAQLIGAAARLRAAWPGLKLRLVNAEYDLPRSAAEIAACRALAEASGLTDAIEWHTGFLPDAESLDLLAGCDVIALPTEGSKEGSSASLRTAMASGVPLIVTPIPFYAEAADAVSRFPGFDAEALAEGLHHLLADPDARQRLQAAARAWLDRHDWQTIGRRTQGMLVGLARTAALRGPATD